jgi:beta-lactam-binding protein with PASTA domain
MTVEERHAIPDLMDDELQGGSPLVTPVDPAVSDRSGPRRTPELIGLDALEAHALARDSALRLVVEVWQTVVGPWGRVLDQQPSPGSHVRRGGSIRIVVSGRPVSPVPDVGGLPLSAAIEQLCWLGFVPIAASRRASHSVPAGHIISTSPAAGEPAAHGTVVALVISRAEREASSQP